MKKQLLFLLLCIFCLSSFAEMRVWMDRDGNEYKAEFVRELFDKLTLRDEQGNEFRLAVEDLSDLDQKYLRVMVPPQVEIDFTENSTLLPKMVEPMGDSDQDETIQVSPVIEIKKRSRRPFTSSLKLEVFLIGEEKDGDNFVLFSHSEFKVLFALEHNNVQEFRPDPIKATTFFSSDHTLRRGDEYLGYLLVLSDAQGNVVRKETDIGEWIEDPEVIQNLRDLAIKGAANIYSRHFDKTGQKSTLPRQPYYTYRLHH